MRLLVVEDDPDLNRQLTTALTDAGYVVDRAFDGEEGHYLGETEPYDAVILDIGLPKMDGISVLESWRRAGRVMPVLMLTARDRWSDKVQGFDAGADDYVAKPFHLEEVLARVRALLRRSASETDDEGEVRAQDVRVDVAAHRAFQADRELHLTAKEFDLLRVLVREAGAVVSREVLMREVWGSDPSGSTKTLDMHISWLRRKLGDDANAPRFITTVRGMGFRFETGEA